jgi:ferredoxin
MLRRSTESYGPETAIAKTFHRRNSTRGDILDHRWAHVRHRMNRAAGKPDREERPMPKLTVEGIGEFEVPSGKRLVLALEDEARVDQLHACGGNARCTTCRVEFVAGEPPRMTAAEKNVLAARGLSGVRLSCQIPCDHDMTIRAISRLTGSGRKDAGPRPTEDVQPQPVEWVDK